MVCRMFLCSNQAYKLVVEPETPLNNGENSITEPQKISEAGSITTLARSPVVDSLKSNCISSHLLINLASYITSPNPTPDVRFPCEVTYMMTEEFGANDYEYDSQIKYIND